MIFLKTFSPSAGENPHGSKQMNMIEFHNFSKSVDALVMQEALQSTRSFAITKYT